MKSMILPCMIFLGCTVTEKLSIEEQYRNQSRCIKFSVGKQVYKKHGDHWDIDPPYNISPLERYSIKCIY